jgi:uncharacterized RDD family membrane protein YckC
MEQQRNPYAAPKAPLFEESAPKALPTEADMMEYGGFWRRVGAMILDAIILAPMGIALMIGLNFTHYAYIYYSLPSLVVFLFYHVYLVRRFGGTPGKRIIRMRITMTDGSPITLKAAVIRYMPMLLLAIVSSIATIITSLNLDGSGFESLGYLEKMQAVSQHAPSWNIVFTWVMWSWWIIGAITLAANARKRAVHDFMAGTVVLRDG